MYGMNQSTMFIFVLCLYSLCLLFYQSQFIVPLYCTHFATIISYHKFLHHHSYPVKSSLRGRTAVCTCSSTLKQIWMLLIMTVNDVTCVWVAQAGLVALVFWTKKLQGIGDRLAVHTSSIRNRSYFPQLFLWCNVNLSVDRRRHITT